MPLPLHEKLLRDVLQSVEHSGTFFPDELCSFTGIAGSKSTGGLMVIGRAVNSWYNGWRVEALSDPVVRERIVKNTIEASHIATGCPMAWVLNHWQASDDYNTARSAFWRSAKQVLHQIAAPCSENEWTSSLFWTNLYKVSPHSGGNPSNKLCNVQLAACRSFLDYEIRTAGTPRILFMTGLDWAFPFLPTLDSATFSRDHSSMVMLRGLTTVWVILNKEGV